MKYSRLIVWLIGVGLIILLSHLCSGLIQNPGTLLLDGVVLICAYSLTLYVYGGLFYSNKEFARDIPAAGVRIYALWLYVILSILGIVLGIVYSVSFSWQIFYQLCFLFMILIGLMFGAASTERMHKVADTSQQRNQSKDQLVALAQQLRITASVNTTLDAETRTSINKLCERLTYISPSDTPAAIALEKSLRSTILQIQECLDNGKDMATLSAIVEKATTLLSQRIKTY